MKPVAHSLTLGLHGIALVNALTMAIPSVWQRYFDTYVATFPTSVAQSPRAIQWVSLGFGVVTIGVILYFLITRKTRYLEACATVAARSSDDPMTR
jgi:hypothetical protein